DHAAVDRRADAGCRLGCDRTRRLLVLAPDALPRRCVPVRRVLVFAVRVTGAGLRLGAAAGAVAVAAVPDDDLRARARVLEGGALTIRRARSTREAVRQRGTLEAPTWRGRLTPKVGSPRHELRASVP